MVSIAVLSWIWMVRDSYDMEYASCFDLLMKIIFYGDPVRYRNFIILSY
jgi:hypothetical protein